MNKKNGRKIETNLTNSKWSQGFKNERFCRRKLNKNLKYLKNEN